MDVIDLKLIRDEAGGLYRDGSYFCSEAIISTIRKHIDPEMPERTIAMGSGFPVGMGGSGCSCGAVAGGVIVLGYFFGRVNPRDTDVDNAMELSKELHDSFQANHNVLCCKILTNEMVLGSKRHMEQCVAFTGEVAMKTAEIIARELNIETR
jgi:C_GCAxxG_C_C family probable redox protein